MQQLPPRYHRQLILPAIGAAGQARLAGAQVLIIGLGALGGTIAEQLARAGVGYLRLVDRDVVDETNLHRQVLFGESDARQGVAKAAAAAARLAQVNSGITIEPMVTDVHSGNIERLAGLAGDPHGRDAAPEGGQDAQAAPFRADLILDGTDNAETRYLINDVAVKHALSWVYGACVGTEGRIMPIVPGHTPCLRCVFPEAPGAGELATCDTAGVLGPAAACVAALQAAAAIRLLVEGPILAAGLMAIDAWSLHVRQMHLGQPAKDCPACGRRQFDLLSRPVEAGASQLCGRNAVQVRSAMAGSGLDLARAAQRLALAGAVESTAFMVRCRPQTHPGIRLSVFADGRTLVEGTADLSLARTLVARYVGA